MHLRYPAVQGSFYPESSQECNLMINQLLSKVVINQKIQPRAFIVPHAGWVYSGQTAAFVYAYLKEISFKRVIILAPSHHSGFTGLSISEYDAYLVNNQQIEIDRDYLDDLKDKFDFVFYEQAHKYEHSDEVQLPFLNYTKNDYKMISILYSYDSYQNIVHLLKVIMSNPDNILLVSSDLSHYHNQSVANNLDKFILEGVVRNDLDQINRGEACGKAGIMAVTKAAYDLNLSAELLDYRTSGDVSGDYDKVVGYASFAFYKH